MQKPLGTKSKVNDHRVIRKIISDPAYKVPRLISGILISQAFLLLTLHSHDVTGRGFSGRPAALAAPELSDPREPDSLPPELQQDQIRLQSQIMRSLLDRTAPSRPGRCHGFSKLRELKRNQQ